MVVFGIVSTVIFIAIIAFMYFRWYKALGELKQLGYENLAYTLWKKDGDVFFFPDGNRNNVICVNDVVGISEITRNSRLIQLEIRYRKNGVVKSRRVSGDTSYLLTIMDYLGYGG